MSNYEPYKSNDRVIDNEDPRYKCCLPCCDCHVISCAKGWSIVDIFCGTIFIILVIVLLALKVPLSVLDPESQETNSTSTFFKTISTISIYVDIIEIVIITITSALVLYGIHKIIPKALLPALVVTGVVFIIDIIFDVVEIAKMLTNKEDSMLIIPFFLVFLLGCYITFLFIRMYYRSYQYLREVEGRKNNAVYPI
uniref:Lysosomal-associated transmembrane protein 4A n=1 Tax=Acrobeloides nanus TaxID=290746 RepID=A0A914EM62_9BILA